MDGLDGWSRFIIIISQVRVYLLGWVLGVFLEDCDWLVRVLDFGFGYPNDYWIMCLCAQYVCTVGMDCASFCVRTVLYYLHRIASHRIHMTNDKRKYLGWLFVIGWEGREKKMCGNDWVVITEVVFLVVTRKSFIIYYRSLVNHSSYFIGRS